MNKKQFLATALAGLITLNTLGGCSNKEVLSNSLDSNTNTEEVLDEERQYEKIFYDDYRITITNGSVLENEIPEGFILIGDKAYKVEKSIIDTHTYSAAKTINEDGTISYFAPFGGILKGNKVYIETSHYELVLSRDEAIDVIYHGLLDKISLQLHR